MAARSVWAAEEDGEVWVHLGGVERINVTRLQAEVERLREALREYGSHQSWRCDHPDRYPQDEDCPCELVATFRALGVEVGYASPCRNA